MMECGICLQKLAALISDRKFKGWYHLKENLYKVGGSLKRLKAAETFLWLGQIESARALFADLKKKSAPSFHQLS